MRVVLVREFGRPPELTRTPDPRCPPDGVVVAVEATGLCRSDWHGWMGHDEDIELPHVPTLDEVRRYAERTLAQTPSLDQIAERARQLVMEAVAVRLVQHPGFA